MAKLKGKIQLYFIYMYVCVLVYKMQSVGCSRLVDCVLKECQCLKNMSTHRVFK